MEFPGTQKGPRLDAGVLLSLSMSTALSDDRSLAAVALQKVHRVDGNCVAADAVVFVVQGDLP
jgi:hypothetical protein